MSIHIRKQTYYYLQREKYSLCELTPSDFLSGKIQVSPPAVKLQYTLKESLEHPWLGSTQYSPRKR